MTDNSAISDRLETSRRELLDLTTRNRLLNTPRHRVRSRSIEIVDEHSDQVFRILVQDRKAMSFLPAGAERRVPSGGGAASDDAKPSVEAPGGSKDSASAPEPVDTKSAIGQPNQRIGPWVLERLLGRGTFGEVWKARHHQLVDRLAAVKIATDAAYVRFLRDESRITHRLSHPCIASVLDADPFADVPYLATEYVEGCSLRDRIQNLPLSDSVRIARQVLGALEYAHAAGTIHHDIKPENVLLANDGTVRLVDFGLGKAQTESARSIVQSSDLESETARGLRGSLPYMAPEQVNGQSVDHRCDLYAFGRVWFEMLCGRLPLGWDERPSTLRPGLERTCDEVYQRATASLAQRAGSAAELLRMIESIDVSEDTSASTGIGDAPRAAAASQPVDSPRSVRSGPRRPGDTQLQTTQNAGVLQARLLSLHRDANTFEEEQGVSPLFLALGFLKWYERDHPGRARYAPLLLVPVEIERASVRASFRVRHTGEDIATNLSLQARLKDEFGIELPDVPPLEDLSSDEYFKQVAEAATREGQWEVLPDDMVLTFFSFSKFLMYRDLDPDTWPDDRKIVDHRLIGPLLGDGFAPEAPLCGEDGDLDDLIPTERAFHILDADSSQAHVIEEARRGRNLVIQGPPGTGKSQTIANLMATAVKEGKKVLFVAEKMAALSVVKRRLDQIGLGDLCLELHSRKANKRLVLDELKRTLELGAPCVADIDTEASRLRQLRDRLNGYVKALHQRHEPSGLSAHQVLGELVRLRSAGVGPVDFELDDAVSWTADGFRERVELTQAAAAAIGEIGRPVDHPCRGICLETALPGDLARWKERFSQFSAEMARMVGQLGSLANRLCTDMPPDVTQAVRLVRLGRSIADAPDMDRRAVRSGAWLDRRTEIRHLIESGQSLAGCRKKLNGVVTDDAWGTDLKSMRRGLAAHGNSWWRIFKSEYRRAVADYTALLVTPSRQPLGKRLDILMTLSRGQQAIAALRKGDELGREAFGDNWRGEQSNWAALARIESWVASNESSGEIERSRAAMAADTAPAEMSATVSAAAESLDSFISKARELFTDLRLDTVEAFSAERLVGVRFDQLRDRLQAWQGGFDRLPAWIAFRSRYARFKQLGMSPLADRLFDGRMGSESAVDALRLACHETLLRRLLRENPVVGEFDGRMHERLQDEFCAADMRRIELARQEVAKAHFSGIPRGVSEIGQMGIIRREIFKQRRHLPLRQLLRRAGQAVQCIKPVMMMSPISVAQYLEPGGVEFDLLLVDEASQVRPVDALGAIARSKQMVVVGDDRQLPPTTFFDRMLGAEEDEDAADSFSAGDVESILGLCSAQRVANRMLRWHYRSRHHSLIAVSNSAFYEGRLHVAPSPTSTDADGRRLGLELRAVSDGIYDRGGTRRNGIEARAVAAAVMEHARHNPALSLGVGAFSVEQRDAIIEELEGLREREFDFEPFFSPEQPEPFFVKNLENIQGDERDVVFISVGYGKDSSGRIMMNFGPLSGEGGERRLNVLITRARRRCVVFTGLTADDIDPDRFSGRGPAALKSYLQYAAHSSSDEPERPRQTFTSSIEESVAHALSENGLSVKPGVGTPGLLIDLAVSNATKRDVSRLGIVTDGPEYCSARWARDRDRLRKQVFEDRGWALQRIWSPDWFNRPDVELKRCLDLIESAKNTPPAPSNKVAPGSVERLDTSLQPDSGKQPLPPEPVPVIPYAEAAFEVPKSQHPHQLPIDHLAAIVRHVVQIEGPIHEEEVARRIVRLWGKSRLTVDLARTVNFALHRALMLGHLQSEESFFDVPNRDSIPIRDRSRASPTIRRPEMLPPSEIRTAIAQVVKVHVGSQSEQTIQEVARLLGFRTLMPPLRAKIEFELNGLIEAGKLRQDSSGLFLKDP